MAATTTFITLPAPPPPVHAGHDGMRDSFERKSQEGVSPMSLNSDREDASSTTSSISSTHTTLWASSLLYQEYTPTLDADTEAGRISDPFMRQEMPADSSTDVDKGLPVHKVVSLTETEMRNRALEDLSIVGEVEAGRNSDPFARQETPADSSNDMAQRLLPVRKVVSLTEAEMISNLQRASSTASLIDEEEEEEEPSVSPAMELFYRLNCARQTMDFVKRQKAKFCTLNRFRMTPFEALSLVNELERCEIRDKTLRCEIRDGVLSCKLNVRTVTLVEHGFATAEILREWYPEETWLHLVGLLHVLGHLLALKDFEKQPLWAIHGETFPLGCRFDPDVAFAQYFTANPDRRKRAYSTRLGIYTAGCGLDKVELSWSGNEYLYQALSRNKTRLPKSALFAIRCRSFDSLECSSSYKQLLSNEDANYVPFAKALRKASEHATSHGVGKGLPTDDMLSYYTRLMHEYLPRKLML